MAGVQDQALAIAVSRAGGLGSLPCAMLGIAAMGEQIAAFRSATDGPLNTNFFCHTPPEPDAARELAWRKQLQPYFARYNIDPDEIVAGPPRRAFSHDTADALEGFRPEVVSFHFGLPSADLVQRVKAWGSLVIASATTVEEAQWLQARGVDAIIAQGSEAGGHRGMFLTEDTATQTACFSLVPRMLQRVEVPVIAAGGIATAAGVASALSMGAAAVQLGTAYLLCDEARTSNIHRCAIKSEAVKHTALTNVFSGRLARSIVNRAVKELGPVNSCIPDFPLAATAVTALRQKAEAVGNDDFSPLWCGENARGCREISAYEMTQLLAGEIRSGCRA